MMHPPRQFDPDMPEWLQGAQEYVDNGGLGELIGFTHIYAANKESHITCQTDVMMYVLLLASEALAARALGVKIT